MKPVDPSQPQALVVADSGRACVRHVLGHVEKGQSSLRYFLIALISQSPVTWGLKGAKRLKGLAADTCDVALGLTYAGLLKLDVPRHVRRALHQRAPAFCEGPVARAAEYLGDTGASAPQHWLKEFDDSLHFVLTLHADKVDTLNQLTQSVQNLPGADQSIRLVWHDGAWLGHPDGEQGQWMHFGYRDGLTHVRLDHDAAAGARPMPGKVAVGEVLLGHSRQHGDNPWLLARQRSQLLRELFLDGSFGVLRMIKQHTEKFDDYVEDAAAVLASAQSAPAAGVGEELRDYVKAKLCGRWPDGRGFDPEADWMKPAGDKRAVPPETFDFSGDRHGFGCPYGSHVRRLQAASPNANEVTGVVHRRLRVLVRRSRPYGPPSWGVERHKTVERGLLGLFFCSSLEDQFEHLMGQWVEALPLGLPGKRCIKDPLIGSSGGPDVAYATPIEGDEDLKLPPPPCFVQTRGTAYAFYPGRRGLQLLLNDRDLLDDSEEEPLT